MSETFYDYWSNEFTTMRTNTPKYDFVRDMLDDEHFPQEGDDTVIMEYLEKNRACNGAIKAFRQLWNEYADDMM